VRGWASASEQIEPIEPIDIVIRMKNGFDPTRDHLPFDFRSTPLIEHTMNVITRRTRQ
jgi:hypothetical protein